MGLSLADCMDLGYNKGNHLSNKERMAMTSKRPAAERVLRAAIAYNGTDAARIHHLIKVTGFAQAIAEAEVTDEDTRYTLEIAAILHDIGIHEAERKHGSSAGPYQEQEGPAVARSILEPLGMPEEITERVCWLIAHHHTVKPIGGMDHQILLEADFLVNAYEDQLPHAAAETFCRTVARTKTGTEMIRSLYLSNE